MLSGKQSREESLEKKKQKRGLSYPTAPIHSTKEREKMVCSRRGKTRGGKKNDELSRERE